MTSNDVYGLIKDEERYLNILGQPGSTPVDLFHDILDDVQTDYARLKETILMTLGHSIHDHGEKEGEEDQCPPIRRMNLSEFIERFQTETKSDTIMLTHLHQKTMGSKYPLNDIIKEEEKVEEGGGVPESHHHLQLPMTTHAELSYDLETMRMYFHTLLTKILTELPDLNTKWNNVRRDIHVS
jgi:hypothetical protein